MVERVEISTREELGMFFKNQPIEWSQVIAMRTAMRVLPLANRAFPYGGLSDNNKIKLINITNHACFILWAARKYQIYDIRKAASRVADISNASNASNGKMFHIPLSASTTIYAAGHATSTASFAAYAVAVNLPDAAEYACAAANASFTAATYATIHFDIIWHAISTDVTSLLSGTTPTTLASSPLWPDGEPEWAAKERRALFALPIDDLDVWENWYQRISQGKTPFGFGAKADEALSLKIATQDDAFWDRDFGVVNGDIKGWIEEVRVKAKKQTKSLVSKQTIRDNIPEVVISAKNLQNLIASAISELEVQKPNSDENLAGWEAKLNLLKDIENKAAQIVDTLKGINSQCEITPAVEKSASLISELLIEFEVKIRKDKSEITDWFIRLPVALGFCGLAGVVGASMPVATPLILGYVCGEKMYKLVKDGSKNKDSE